MNEEEYREIFVKTSVYRDSIDYVLNSIREVHSPEYGWEVGTPRITDNGDGTVRIEVELVKRHVKNR